MADSIATHLNALREIFQNHGFSMPLAPPASQAEIAAAQAETGIEFDADLREFYSLTNGSAGVTWLVPIAGRLTTCELPTIDECLDAWRSWLPYDEADLLARWGPPEPGRDARIRPEWRRRGWFPLAEFNGGSTQVFFDADPAPGGTRGQIILYQHDPDEIRWCAHSLGELFEQSNLALEDDFDELIMVDDDEPFYGAPPRL